MPRRGESERCHPLPHSRASASRSKWTPVTVAAAAPKITAMRRLDGTEPVHTTRIPASSGPTNVPIPSPMLEATFAATSSPGVRARAGRSAYWIGRTSEPAPATTAASAYMVSIGAPTATTAAVATAPPHRTTLITVRTRSPRNRSTSVVANGAATIAGTTLTAPRMPTASVPPSSYATTSRTTRKAQSAAVPRVQASSMRRIARFRRTSRTADAADAAAWPLMTRIMSVRARLA